MLVENGCNYAKVIGPIARRKGAARKSAFLDAWEARCYNTEMLIAEYDIEMLVSERGRGVHDLSPHHSE
jgi:hypothetical protein